LDVLQKGGGRRKKSPQDFLRRSIYYAKPREKSQTNEKIEEKQALESKQFAAFCLISLGVVILQSPMSFG
jgi:hypothetical protein